MQEPPKKYPAGTLVTARPRHGRTLLTYQLSRVATIKPYGKALLPGSPAVELDPATIRPYWLQVGDYGAFVDRLGLAKVLTVHQDRVAKGSGALVTNVELASCAYDGAPLISPTTEKPKIRIEELKPNDFIFTNLDRYFRTDGKAT